jgi:hypothetical protein
VEKRLHTFSLRLSVLFCRGGRAILVATLESHRAYSDIRKRPPIKSLKEALAMSKN